MLKMSNKKTIGIQPIVFFISLYPIICHQNTYCDFFYSRVSTCTCVASRNSGTISYLINRPDDNGTTIFKKDIEISGDKNKKLPFEFKRQLDGGKPDSL